MISYPAMTELLVLKTTIQSSTQTYQVVHNLHALQFEMILAFYSHTKLQRQV